MNTCVKVICNEYPSGVATQKISPPFNATNVAVTEVQTEYHGMSENVSINNHICGMHQRGVLRDVLLKDQNYGDPATKTLQRRTITCAAKQRDTPLKQRKNRAAEERENCHVHGSSPQKLPKRKLRTKKHRKDAVPTKGARSQEIRERREEASRSKDPMSALYEGLLDCKMSVEPSTMERFSEVFEGVLNNLKQAINNNKMTLSHVLKIDGETLGKLFFSVALLAVSALVIVRYDSIGGFLKFILAGVATIGSGWLCSAYIKKFFLEYIVKAVTGRDFAAEFDLEQLDLDELNADVMAYCFGETPAGAGQQPVDCESMFSERWNSCHEDHANYEGLFDGGGSTLVFALTEICAGALSVMTGSFFTGSTKGLAEKLVKSHRTANDVKFVFTEMMKWLASKVDSIFGTQFKALFARNQSLEEWSDEVQKQYTNYAEGRMTMTATAGRRINALMLRGLEIARRYEHMDQASWALHRFCTSLVQKMESAAGAAGAPLSERQVPLVVVLRGESGIGKSYIQHALIDEIAMNVLETQDEREDYAKNHGNEKYMWLSEEEHANGYFGQFACIFDDFGQFLTQKGQADDYIRIIRMANAAPCRLNAAELERKGRVVFTSPLIMCSSNLYKYWGVSLAKNEALVRRFDVVVDMVPRQEFCTDKTVGKEVRELRLDVTKITKKIEYDACEYRLLKCTDAEQQTYDIERVCTFAELVEVCKTRFLKHKSNHLGLMEALSERRNTLLEERNDEEGTPEYEGWIDWFKAKGSSMGKSVAQKCKELKDKVKKEIYTLYLRSRNIGWKEMVAAVVLVLSLALMCFGLKELIKKFFNRRNKPGAFVDEIFTTATGDPEQTFKRFIQTQGTKKANRVISDMRAKIAAKGKVYAFNKELVCSLQEFDAWVADLNVPSYEAELLGPEEGEIRMFHNTLMRSILDKNVYHMYRPFDDPDTTDSVGKITMVSGTVGVMNYHYITQMRKLMRLDNPQMQHVVLVSHKDPGRAHKIPLSWFLDEENLSFDSQSDIVLVQFGKTFPVHKDIVKHFVTEESIEQNRDFDAALFAPRAPRCIEIYDLGHRLASDPIRIEGNVHTNVVRYRACTQTGDCGSLLAYTGDFSNCIERICGIHMAGLNISGQKQGYATVVTQQALQTLLEKFSPQPRIFADVDVEGNFLKQHDVCHEVVKRLERPIFQPVKTCIVQSELFGEIGPVTKAPAKLAPYTTEEGRVDPVVNAHLRQHSYNVDVDEGLLSLVVDHVTKSLMPHVKHRGVLLNFEESVAGRKDLPCLGPIPRQTSAGFTYRNDPRVKKGKKDFFGYDGDYVFDTELCDDLRKRVQNLHDQAKDGIVFEERVYVDVLKDESLALEKVHIGKTRMISACDLPLSVLYRQYYGALCNDLVQTRLENGIAVGINPFSREWDLLARKLNSKGKKVVAGDFSGYDNSQSCQLIRATVEVMNRLAGHESEESKRVMEVLAVTLAQPYHASGGAVYQLDHGMPSGNPMTTIMNSIFGLIAFRLCWLRCSAGIYGTPSAALRAFEREVYLVMYGDDNLLNITDGAAKFFNQTTMIEHFPLFGLKYTSDAKNDVNPPPHRDLTEVTFLKRTFQFDETMSCFVAPLNLETITNMIHWTKKGASKRSITLDNCTNAMREWSLHGKSTYEGKSAALKEAVLRRMGEVLHIESHKEALTEVCTHVPTWIREHM